MQLKVLFLDDLYIHHKFDDHHSAYAYTLALLDTEMRVPNQTSSHK